MQIEQVGEKFSMAWEVEKYDTPVVEIRLPPDAVKQMPVGLDELLGISLSFDARHYEIRGLRFSLVACKWDKESNDIDVLYSMNDLFRRNHATLVSLQRSGDSPSHI